MIFHLARSYYLIAFTLTLMFMVPLVVGGNPEEVLPKALCWAAPLASVILFFEFRRQNYWALYDNLRISRFLYLILFPLPVLICGVILIVML